VSAPAQGITAAAAEFFLSVGRASTTLLLLVLVLQLLLLLLLLPVETDECAALPANQRAVFFEAFAAASSLSPAGSATTAAVTVAAASVTNAESRRDESTFVSSEMRGFSRGADEYAGNDRVSAASPLLLLPPLPPLLPVLLLVSGAASLLASGAGLDAGLGLQGTNGRRFWRNEAAAAVAATLEIA
jgi:hypothetical protein